MNEAIPQLNNFDEPSLDAAFATLAEEVRTADRTDVEAFRLQWLGRKQGRLKLISEAWLKSAPPEAKKALGIRFNQLKQQIEQALESPSPAQPASTVPQIDITLPGAIPTHGNPHPLLKNLHDLVHLLHQLG
jgi:phenylalanyl-tRNA synthetase alpha chain